MALARDRSTVLAPESIVEPAPLGAPWRGAIRRTRPIAVEIEPPVPIRRCVFRRLSPIAGRGTVGRYAAECLYEGVERAAPLGDLAAARRACEACTRTGLWRADED